MLIIEFGIVIDSSFLQRAKASVPMLFIELGMNVLTHPRMSSLVAVSIIALQLLRESYFGFCLSIVIDSSSPQQLKAL
jgi:hypothetical protein